VEERCESEGRAWRKRARIEVERWGSADHAAALDRFDWLKSTPRRDLAMRVTTVIHYVLPFLPSPAAR
jgi:hypothetical protein